MVRALAVFAGTIIGVGIFGLPYIALKSGFFVVLIYFIIVAGLAISVHYLLGEIAHDTIRIARIPGYAEEYLGSAVKKFSFIISSLGLIGALLAYLILGGVFLHSFFSPFLGGPIFLYTLFFFAAGAVLIYRGIGTIGMLQVIIQAIFIMLLFLFFFKGLPFLDVNNFFTFDVHSLALPYGVILFSLWGVALVPEIKEMVNRDRKKMIYVLVGGVILAALCYLFFIVSILGVSGINTTKDAITGFSKAIGNKVVAVGYVFGLIITFTSFITLGLTLKKIFCYDMKLNRFISWAFAVFAPLALYAFGLRNFIDVIGITGALFLGTEGIIVILIYRKFIRVRFQRRPGAYTYGLIALLIGGMVTQFVHFFL